MSTEGSTLLVDRSGARVVWRAPDFGLEVIEGPDTGKHAAAVAGRLSVGTAEGVTLRLGDPTVSRFHAELVATDEGIALRDLGSTNGTLLAGAMVREVVLRRAAEIRFGKSKARLTPGATHSEIPTSQRTSFGELTGASPAMRHVYSLLERAAPTSAPVLVTGESGTGKELAARALHDASPRRDAPFEVLDCGGLPATLIESELFGHERGAFTGALAEREGAFERAHSGTLFLDELGELPLELQPKLLRALGEGEVRRLGGRQARTVDVRLVAATNRDLRREVNAGAFRADLYYRLAVIEVRMPPLRERLDDLALIVPPLLERIAADRGLELHVEPDDALLEAIARHHWPGNVRELRNYLEQLLILRAMPALPDGEARLAPAGGVSSDALLAELVKLPLRSAKARLVERFERSYVDRLLEETSGNVAEAARRAGVDRGTLFRTIRRHGIKVGR
jgi:DNA-binding NtrC family response regulator